jgi:ABC-type dipeptide/oligopeptide/nickel transport system permease subunit
VSTLRARFEALPPALRGSAFVLGGFAVLAFAGGALARAAGAPLAVMSWFDGARLALAATAAVVVTALGPGLALGAAAALGPRWIAAGTSRALEVAGALPSVIVAVVLRSLGPPRWDFAVFVLVLAALRSLETARVVRASVLALESEDFVMAARALGSGPVRLFRRHLLPHLLGPALASAAVTAAAIVGLDAALAFLALGSRAPTWGTQIAAAAEQKAFGLAFLPSVSLALLTVCLYVAADALDGRVRLRRRFV